MLTSSSSNQISFCLVVPTVSICHRHLFGRCPAFLPPFCGTWKGSTLTSLFILTEGENKGLWRSLFAYSCRGLEIKLPTGKHIISNLYLKFCIEIYKGGIEWLHKGSYAPPPPCSIVPNFSFTSPGRPWLTSSNWWVFYCSLYMWLFYCSLLRCAYFAFVTIA